MPYTLKQTTSALSGGKNILASLHVQFVEVGATLTGGVAYALGEAVAKIGTTGLWVKYVSANAATYTDLGILNIDVKNVAENTIVGEIIVRGSVYAAKLPASVTAEFKTKTPNIRYLTR